MLDEQERTVTFVLKFKQKDVPMFLWDSLMGKPQSEIPGCRVVAIAEGDVIKEYEEFEKIENEDIEIEDGYWGLKPAKGMTREELLEIYPIRSPDENRGKNE